MLNPSDRLRYSQQIQLENIGIEGQSKLKDSKVLCIGLGGLGTPLLLYLAASGIGTLGIIDDDQVELSNLHRQILYRDADISINKALASKTALLVINPLITVHAYSEKLTQENSTDLIRQYDIIADCTDNYLTRYLIHDTCYRERKPYVYATASKFQGQCSLFDGNEGPCLRCLYPSPYIIGNCANSGVLGVVPGILGLIQATEILKWILKIGESLKGKLLVVDLLKMTFQEIQLTKNADCKFCNSM
jgi:sulfur-carrier protein adenylyltransferase/sulfurtransferase